jgi:hypothetical protein
MAHAVSPAIGTMSGSGSNAVRRPPAKRRATRASQPNDQPMTAENQATVPTDPPTAFPDFEHVHAVPIPEPLRRAFPERVLRDWLRRLCRELDLRLHAPISVLQQGPVRIVRVFRVLEYVVDLRRRKAYGRLRCAGRVSAPETEALDLLRPMRTQHWVPWFMGDTGIWPLEPPVQGDLFERERRACRNWLTRSLFELLQRDRRFIRLRRKVLRETVALDPDLVQIALRSRLGGAGTPVLASDYNRVWRNERAYRQVARENPQLLPLLHAWLECNRLAPTVDPVRALKTWFRDEGVPEGGWRYVCRHGARLFRAIWALTPCQSPISVALLYTLRLHQCGLPPPPPTDFLEAWATAVDLYDLLFDEPSWSPGLCAVYRISMHEAARVRRTAVWPQFMEDFLGVTYWVQESGLAPDRNQRRAGWASLVRRWRNAIECSDVEDVSWVSLLVEFETGAYCIVPLTSSRQLAQEAMAMRNCLASYAKDAQANGVRLFSIRARDSGRRVADLALRLDTVRNTWRIDEVAGFANRGIPDDIIGLAKAIEADYNALYTSGPNLEQVCVEEMAARRPPANDFVMNVCAAAHLAPRPLPPAR